MNPMLQLPLNARHLQTLVSASVASEVRLPDNPPLTLTRNFAWVLAVCLGSLLVLPLTIAWTASFFFS